MSKKSEKENPEAQSGIPTANPNDQSSAGQSAKVPTNFPPLARALTVQEVKAFQRQSCAEAFAAALLRNPKIDIFLLGSPLDPGQRGDAPNAGALLARGAARLADDYLAEVDALQGLNNKPVPMDDGIPNIGSGGLVTDSGNGFPQD